MSKMNLVYCCKCGNIMLKAQSFDGYICAIDHCANVQFTQPEDYQCSSTTRKPIAKSAHLLGSADLNQPILARVQSALRGVGMIIRKTTSPTRLIPASSVADSADCAAPFSRHR